MTSFISVWLHVYMVNRARPNLETVVFAPDYLKVGSPQGNATCRNAARTNAVAISSLKHLNGGPIRMTVLHPPWRRASLEIT